MKRGSFIRLVAALPFVPVEEIVDAGRKISPIMSFRGVPVIAYDSLPPSDYTHTFFVTQSPYNDLILSIKEYGDSDLIMK